MMPSMLAAKCLYSMATSRFGVYTVEGIVFDNASRTLMSSGSAAKTGTPVASSISSTVNSKSLW